MWLAGIRVGWRRSLHLAKRDRDSRTHFRGVADDSGLPASRRISPLSPGSRMALFGIRSVAAVTISGKLVDQEGKSKLSAVRSLVNRHLEEPSRADFHFR